MGKLIQMFCHPMSHLNMVFYAAAAADTGKLVFDNPARGHFQHFYPPEISWMPYRFSIQPTSGLFVVEAYSILHAIFARNARWREYGFGRFDQKSVLWRQQSSAAKGESGAGEKGA